MITILERRSAPAMASAGSGAATLDAVVPAADVVRLPQPTPAPGGASPQTARLVLVDDDQGLRQALQELLVDAGYRVVGEAGNGVDGLAVIAQCRPDVVLLDLRMPIMGGVEVARALQEQAPDVRIIMLSAYADLGLQRILGELGVSAYLIKGCPYRRIVAAIDTALADARGSS
ncbi:MAG TPA: response regulator [Candidatus Nanopelagicales bacterium]